MWLAGVARMKHWTLWILGLCLMSAACGSTSPSSPSNTNTANTVRFTANLNASNEVPAVTNAESAGSGTATITFNLTRDTAGALQSGNVDFHVTLTGFPAGTVITAAHIHPGAAGDTGSPAIGVTAGLPLTLTNGAGTLDATGIVANVTTLQAIIDAPANYYFNVHSPANPSGTARGQLVKQ